VIAAGGFEPLFEDVRASVEDATSEVLASPAPALDQILSHVTAASAGGDQRWNFWSK
jgi:pyruvate dehydrogenase E1 component alpha subunit